MVQILLADRHEIVRLGVRGLLEAERDWRVVAEARTGSEAVALAERLRPDVAILDLAIPELEGLEATRRIRWESPDTEVLIFTMDRSERQMREALRAGARGYLLKSEAAERLVAAVAAVAAGRPYVSARFSEALLGDQGDAEALTGREREVMQLLAEGQGNKEVAEALGISVKTAETHRAAIMRKLGLGSLAELVRYAVRNRLIEP